LKPATAKAKGAETEIKYVQYLNECGIANAERRHLQGQFDKGDIAGWAAPDGSWNICVEVKSGAALDLPKWIRELASEMKNAKSEMGHIAVRPKGKPDPHDWWVIMPADLHMKLMRKAGYA
jgi:hypothetical protein